VKEIGIGDELRHLLVDEVLNGGDRVGPTLLTRTLKGKMKAAPRRGLMALTGILLIVGTAGRDGYGGQQQKRDGSRHGDNGVVIC
jgi:hypothetical protein